MRSNWVTQLALPKGEDWRKIHKSYVLGCSIFIFFLFVNSILQNCDYLSFKIFIYTSIFDNEHNLI